MKPLLIISILQKAIAIMTGVSEYRLASHMNGFPQAADVDKFHGFINYCLQRFSETLKTVGILKLSSYVFKRISKAASAVIWKGF
jgi:hypothetical protein